MSLDPSSDKPRRGRLWLLLLLAVAGLIIGWAQPWGVDDLLGVGHAFAAQPLFLGMVVLAMAVLFSFGLPGSLGVWLIAPFQPPLVATSLLVIGSVAGALGAYHFSARLRGDWQPEGLSRRVVDLLSRHGGWATQTALRVLPGFPHSVVNFAGGVLSLGRPGFLGAALIGLSIKWAVYASAIHGLVEAVESDQAMALTTIWPLLLLSLFLLLGTAARHWLLNRDNG